MKKYISVFAIFVFLLAIFSSSCFAASESKTIVDYVYRGLGGFCILFNDGTVYEVFNGGEIGSCQAENVERIQCKNSPVFYKKDGTISIGTPFGWSSQKTLPYELDDTWTDIVLADAGHDHAVGMKADGTMVSAGNYVDGQCNITDWTDIVDLRVGEKHTVGLKSDGTVVATGNNKDGQCDVSSWTDIINIYVDEDDTTIGLKSDGTVVATGKKKNDYSQWKNVAFIVGCYNVKRAITTDNSILSTYSSIYEDKSEYGIPFDYVFDDIKNIYFNSGSLCAIIIHNDNTCEFFADYYEKDSYNVAQVKAEYDFIQNGLNGVASTAPENPAGKDEQNIAATTDGFSFAQVVDMIDAVAVDGKKMFNDSKESSVLSNEREDFFTMQGAALIWMGDIKEGTLWLYDNQSDAIHMWNSIDTNNIRNTFDIIGPIVAPYVDYNIGGKLTLILTKSDSSFTSPFAKIEYSPSIDNAHQTNSASYNEYYSGLDSFYSSVKRWFNVAFGEENADTVHQDTEQQNNSSDFSILQKGSKGDDVKKLQNRLNEMGYSVGTADGDFGNKTKSAIEQFQKDNGLDVTGVADQATQELLFSDGTGKPVDGSSDREDVSSLIPAGIKYISNSVMEIAPALLGVSEDQCKITEIYCLDKGDNTYQFTARVSRGGSGGYGIGKELNITQSQDGSWDIEDLNHITMYGGSDKIPGDLVFGNEDDASLARGLSILGEELKQLDFNGDGELSMDEIFKMD